MNLWIKQILTDNHNKDIVFHDGSLPPIINQTQQIQNIEIYPLPVLNIKKNKKMHTYSPFRAVIVGNMLNNIGFELNKKF